MEWYGMIHVRPLLIKVKDGIGKRIWNQTPVLQALAVNQALWASREKSKQIEYNYNQSSCDEQMLVKCLHRLPGCKGLAFEKLGVDRLVDIGVRQRSCHLPE